MFFFLSIHEYRNETFKIKSQFFSLHTLNIGSAVKKIPIFFFTHSKYRIIFNEWKTTASLFPPAFLFLPTFKAKYSKYSFYIQISSLKQRARLFFPINSTSHEASPAITGGKSRPLENGSDSFKRMRHGCNN